MSKLKLIVRGDFDLRFADHAITSQRLMPPKRLRHSFRRHRNLMSSRCPVARSLGVCVGSISCAAMGLGRRCWPISHWWMFDVKGDCLQRSGQQDQVKVGQLLILRDGWSKKGAGEVADGWHMTERLTSGFARCARRMPMLRFRLR